jgi:hypothetical protein
MSVFINLEGNKYGRLTVLNKYKKIKRIYYWLCRCDCGQEKWFYSVHFKNGDTKSCGCLRKELASKRMTGRKYAFKHGRYGKGEYVSWIAMIKRCSYPTNGNWKNYGGRGIKVCKRWLKFNKFFEDMGPRPKGTSIDRINNNGNYTKSNCRWSTAKEQSNNKRKQP